MTYVPKSTQTLLQSIIARIQARCEISDFAENSSALNEALAFAEELNGAYLELKALRDGYNLLSPLITPQMLLERLKELPPAGLDPLPSAAASGACMVLARDIADAADILNIPAGAVFGRSDNQTLLYRTEIDYALGAGIVSLAGVEVTCLTPGGIGNAPSGTINRIVSAPPRLITAVNVAPLTTGLEGETPEQAQKRAANYFPSLSRVLPWAMEFAALSFVASNHTRLQFAKTYTDIGTPGYAELLVDDGSGLGGLVKAGMASSGTVPANGQTVLWHDMPATAPIAQVTVVRPDATTYTLLEGIDYLSAPEMGLVQIDAGKMAAGDVWTIANYSVFTGIIAELQQYILGDTSNGAASPGWCGTSLRVAVKPPTIHLVPLELWIVPQNFVDLAVLGPQVVDAAVAYLSTLGPGQPLYIAQLINKLLDNTGLLNVRVFVPGTNTPLGDVYPQPREVVRTDTFNATLVAQG